MMQLAKAILIFVLLGPKVVLSNTAPECLEHLGGAYSSVECYNGLTNDLKKEKISLLKSINQHIPKGNKNRKLLREYILSKSFERRFCTIQKESYANWQIETSSANPRYFDYDVVYFECIYSQELEINRFLKNVVKNISPD